MGVHKKKVCKAGHSLEEGSVNIGWRWNKRDGKYQRYCITCHNERQREWWRVNHGKR